MILLNESSNKSSKNNFDSPFSHSHVSILKLSQSSQVFLIDTGYFLYLKKYEDAENYYSYDFFVQFAPVSIDNNNSFCLNAMVPIVLYFLNSRN